MINVEAAFEKRVMKKYRPGPGWRRLSGPVYEGPHGVRVHMTGVVRLADGRYVSGNQLDHAFDMHRMISINGGNRRRGIMAWARQLMAEGA